MQTTYFHQSGDEYKYLNLIEEVDSSSALRLLGMDFKLIYHDKQNQLTELTVKSIFTSDTTREARF